MVGYGHFTYVPTYMNTRVGVWMLADLLAYIYRYSPTDFLTHLHMHTHTTSSSLERTCLHAVQELTHQHRGRSASSSGTGSVGASGSNNGSGGNRSKRSSITAWRDEGTTRDRQSSSSCLCCLSVHLFIKTWSATPEPLTPKTNGYTEP